MSLTQLDPAFLAVGSKSTPSLDLFFSATKALDSRITFTRASVGTYIDSTGALQTASTNVARFTHNPSTLASLGLLVEESRTNILLNSATLSTQSVTTTATSYVLSFTGTGTITLTGTSTAGPLVGTGTGEANRVSLTFTPTAGTLTLTVSGTVTNAQLEAGSFRTSYIPTTSATATRSADVATMTGTNFSSWFNQSEGSFAWEGIKAKNAVPWSISNATLLNRLHPDGTLNRAYAQISSTSESGTFGAGTTPPIGSLFKESIGYLTGSYYYANNQGSTGSAAFVGIPSVNQMQIGNIISASQYSGTVARIRYYRRRLPDASLKTLTT